MKICYVDEAGCTGALPASDSNIQPVLVVAGVMLDYGRLHHLTDSLLNLKQRFFPKAAPVGTSHMGWILREIKGSELRRDACEGSRNIRRHRFGFLKEATDLCEQCDAKLTGRVWVKSIGKPINGTSIYTYSLQSIYADFQNYLEQHQDVGFVIVDSRLKHMNTQAAHSIFTQKFKGTGDAYDRIIEMPAFSHSDNHAGLQVADTICSAIITPLAINTYCAAHLTGVHIRPEYAAWRPEFCERYRLLQHRYSEASGKRRGGLVVSDGLAQKPGSRLFTP